VMGENGAGKSTLMKIIAGVHGPDGGMVSFDGKAQRFAKPQDANNIGIRTVFQELTVLPNRTVAENIFVGREPTSLGGLAVDAAEMKRGAHALLERLGIDIDASTLAGQLSAGKRQMVEIARACLSTPKVLILDEPTSSLGREEELVLFELVEKLKGQGVAIIYITHRMSEVFQLSDQITILRDGKHVATGAASDFDRQSLIKAMVGRDVSDDRHGKQVDDMPIALALDGLRRAPHVRDVSLQVHAGEVLGLAGLMGSGRTELARLAGGIDRPDAGTMSLFGEPFAPSSVRQAIERGVVYVSEDRKQLGLLLTLSVGENIALPSLKNNAGPFGLIKRKGLRTLIVDWMERLGVKAASPDVSINTLSGGNQQKVVLAKWLATEPRVILLDEPTRGVDVGAKAEIYTKIRSLAADGAAILVISSELPEVISLSDRIAVMAQGRLAGIVDASTATEESLLELAFTEMDDAA
ncbi:MAG: sugar ABC transporter ATP-binding protein, partial [Pseudomonadota bacterium]